jgi:hypothetical protein
MLISEEKKDAIINKIIAYLSVGWEDYIPSDRQVIEKEIRWNILKILEDEFREESDA